MTNNNPIIAALDVPDAQQAIKLSMDLAPVVGAVKIGGQLFTGSGPDIVRTIRQTGAAVFLDLKFHDIPNTVAKAVTEATKLDVQMLTVHTSGGPAMLAAAENAAQETARSIGNPPPLVLGVTVLTSMDKPQLEAVGVDAEIEEQVERLAIMASKSGIRGLVCSPLELPALRKILPKDFQLVTPGIRAATDAMGDQKRTLSAPQAIAAGASWLVVGRPIYASDNPVESAQSIFNSISAE